MTEDHKRYLTEAELEEIRQNRPANRWQAKGPPNRQQRPQPEPAASSTRILLAIGWGILVLGSIYAIASWLRLPEQVPVHFGPNGEPDAWGSKYESIIGLAVLLPSTVLCLVLARFPKIHNVPFNYETNEKWQRFYTLSANLCAWLGIGMALFIPEIAWATAHPATLPWLFWIPLAICILPLFFYFPAMVKLRKRKPARK